MRRLKNSGVIVARNGRRQALLIAVGLLGLVLPTSSALGATREARERVARAACLAGDYNKGVTILSQLFVETEDANYIYNQGRCFEQNARYQDAITRFQEYLRVQKTGAEDRAEARKHIADCQAMLAAQAGQPPARSPGAPEVPAPSASAVTRDLTVPATRIAAGQPLVDQAPPPSPGSSGSGLRTAGIVTAAVGGAALAAGIVLNVKVNSMASDFQTLNGYTDGKESDRRTYETLGWASYGLGATCVAAGAILYVLGLENGASGPPAALLPAPGGAVAMVEGAF